MVFLIRDGPEDIQKLKEIFGEDILSIIKYGFGKRNLMIVLSDVSLSYLQPLKPYIMRLKRKKRILVLGASDITSGAIGIDLLNIQLTSVVIYGKDLFKDLSFDEAKIKRQLKYDAHRMLVGLRDEYLSYRWSWDLKKVLASTVPRLLPLIVAHMYLLGEKIPNAIPDTINKYVKHNEDALVLLKIRHDLNSKEIEAIFEDIFTFLADLPERI